MPTISQLPIAQSATAGDLVPISQAGSAHAVALGTLLAGTQPAIIVDQGSLLGRVSLGAGGPEEISLGAGLVLSSSTLQATGLNPGTLTLASGFTPGDSAIIANSGTGAQLLALTALRGLFTAGNNVAISADGTISATSTGGASGAIANLPAATTAAAGDLIGISQSGTDHAIAYSSLINGQTIDQAAPAQPVSDGDSFWVAQGSNTMAAQTFSAIWPWIVAKLLTVKTPVVEITVNTTLDGTVHNDRVLICSQPVTLTPIAANMGSGFHCEIINASAGTVTIGGSILSSSGASSINPGQAATLRCLTYSGGTLLYAFMGDGGATVAPPGAVTALTVTATTSNSASLSWQMPTSGGSPTSFLVQYRVSGSTNWTASAAGSASTSATVGNLSASTSYDFSVIAMNSAGSGPISTVVTASTTAAAGAVTAITWNVAPSGSYTHGSGVIGVNVHVTPATAAVQFGFSTSVTTRPTAWTAGALVNTDLWGAYVPTPSTAGTWYAWAEGTDGSSPSVFSTAFTVT
jgi:Fibronectin type III domain